MTRIAVVQAAQASADVVAAAASASVDQAPSLVYVTLSTTEAVLS